MAIETLSTQRCFGGVVVKYKHRSDALQCDMVFNVYLPPAVASHCTGDNVAGKAKLPAIFFLSGLTCNEDNFISKSGATRCASELGVVLICPDTSPRGTNCANETESWDFGQSASYYLDATQPEYSKHYRMYTYITQELYSLVLAQLPVNAEKISIMGHSVGGHGALTIGLKNPNKYRCVSAFAPMANPINAPWGQKAFSRFLGDSDKSAWEAYDATELAKSFGGTRLRVLVDQGADDKFLAENLMTDRFVDAATQNPHLELSYHLRAGYDHSYYFVSSFIDEHLRWHLAHNC
ncbi:hypothetical protein RI367_008355 [Sorochytrium milnesiophthora]